MCVCVRVCVCVCVCACVCVCVLCISGKTDDLEKKDFSLIIGYFNSNFHI